jgi:hypothetical protein
MKNYRTCIQIAEEIDYVLKTRKLTLRECVALYNQCYAKDIFNGKKTPLNKDFIQRLRSGKCKIVSTRVLGLCTFLDVNPYADELPGSVTREIRSLENLIRQRPELEKHLVNLIKSLGNLAKSNLDNSEQGEQ